MELYGLIWTWMDLYGLGWLKIVMGVATPLGVTAAPGEISEVGAMAIGFALETDAHVGLIRSAASLDEPDKPFQNVNDIERQIPQLAHLCGVYPLMIHSGGGEPHRMLGEEHSEEVDSPIILPYRQYPVPNHPHTPSLSSKN